MTLADAQSSGLYATHRYNEFTARPGSVVAVDTGHSGAEVAFPAGGNSAGNSASGLPAKSNGIEYEVELEHPHGT